VTSSTSRVLPARVNVDDPREVEDYLTGVLRLVEDRVGGAMFPDPLDAVITELSASDATRAVSYAVGAELNIPGHQRVVVSAILNGRARAGKVRIQFFARPGLPVWAWHFDSFHLDLGGWGHEHRPGATPERTLSSAQHLDAAVARLFAELWGLQP
jgi:hypothetical protein